MFYGQFNPPVDQFIYERYFKNSNDFQNGVFIECGAFDGLTECSCKFFEETLGWKGINIEPSPMVYEKLVQNRPNSLNINMALSNENGEGIFHAVIHPQFGEQCTNGSLHHTETHLQSLKEMNVTFKEYSVKIITWKDLIKKYKIKEVTLFVLDVEGNELKVIEGMKGCRVLPQIFVVEHGNLNKQELITAVENLGYKYDISNYVNSFFVRHTKWDNLIDRLKLRHKTNERIIDHNFFEYAEQMQYVREGKIVKETFSEYEIDNASFALLAAEFHNDSLILYSIQGINDESSDCQIVYYVLEDATGNKYTFEACQQVREDYAEMRQSELYRKCGARINILKEYFSSNSYTVQIFLKSNKKIKFLHHWKIDISSQNVKEFEV